MKTREFFGMLFFGMIAILPAAAGGSSEAHLSPEATDAAWQGAFNTLTENYSGEAKTYAEFPFWALISPKERYLEQGSYSLTVTYSGLLAKPYVISSKELIDNPNYYYGEKSGKDKDTFLSFETGSSTHSFPEKYLHQFASPTPTKDISPATNAAQGETTGKIRITYTLAALDDAGRPMTKTVEIPVTFERRDCEAYSKDLWIKSGSGWIRK